MTYNNNNINNVLWCIADSCDNGDYFTSHYSNKLNENNEKNMKNRALLTKCFRGLVNFQFKYYVNISELILVDP